MMAKISKGTSFAGCVKYVTNPDKAELLETNGVRLQNWRSAVAPGDEFFINFEVRTTKATPLVPAGHTVACDQFELPVKGEKQVFKAAKAPALEVVENDDAVSVKSAYVNFTFDKSLGMPTSYMVWGVEYFDGGFGIRPNFWRGPTDNDYGNGAPLRLQVWKTISNDPRVRTLEHYQNHDGSITLIAGYSWALMEEGVGMVNYDIAYTVHPSGELKVALHYHNDPLTVSYDTVRLNQQTRDGEIATYSPKTEEELKAMHKVLDIPRIGIRFRIPSSFDDITYFGRGPEENYADRFRGTTVGLYSAKAWKLYHPYVRPQENGHHTQTRWMYAANEKGAGLLVVADDQMEFNALRNSIEDFDCQESDKPYQWNNFSLLEIERRDYGWAANRLRKQTHINDIEPRDFVEICLDGRHQGVAGYNSWGDRPQPYAAIYSDTEYLWGFTLVPVGSKKEIEPKSRLKYESGFRSDYLAQ